MIKAYNRINWVNYPETDTALNALNMNLMDSGINEIDNRVVTFDTTKANQTDLLQSVKSVSYAAGTGTFTFTFWNGSQTVIDTDLEKIPVNFDYDDDPSSPHYQQLILELGDGTYKYIDLSALITEYEFRTSSTITPNISGGNVEFDIINGSITDIKMQPNYLADITAQAQAGATSAQDASNSKLDAEAWAVGKMNGVDVPNSHPAYHNNSYYWSQRANVTSLMSLTDVNLDNLQDDDVLMYDSVGGEWVNDKPSLGLLSNVSANNPVDGQVLAYNGTSHLWENADATGGAMPHLIVISEHGSVVTATRGTTVIPLTETSSGHFEGDLVEVNGTWYGTWTIDAILGGDDAQVSLFVDTVQVYTVDDSHFHADITVTYPTGATVSCTMTGETPMYATGSPYTFVVHQSGTWTITGTRNNITETQQVVITTTGQEESVTLTILPNGSTVTPTDDVQTLLKCADIWDKTTYTTISDLLADSTSLLTVLTSNNAIDYLVRSTTWISDVCADGDAMGLIGLDNYGANTLLADEVWCSAIANSTYRSSVLNISIPTMTSNTTPSGEAFASSQADPAYQAFDNRSATWWSGGVSNAWVAYDFGQPVKVCMADWWTGYAGGQRTKTYKVEATNDKTGTWTTLYEGVAVNASASYEIKNVINSANSYRYWRMFIVDHYMASNYGILIPILQFYGRVDV